jgi:type IV pilus assembly protein PilQ
MRNWTRTAGLLFLATSAVYSNQLAGVVMAGEARDAAPLTAASEPNPAAGEVDPFAEAVPVEAVQNRAGSGSADVRLSDMGTVEIHVNDANLVEVLRMLALQSQKNIVASRDVRGTVTANLYDVTVREALDAILLSNGYAYQEKGNFIYVYTARELQEMERANRVMRTEVFNLHYVSAEEAEEVIRQVLSSEARTSFTRSAQSGIAFNAADAGGHNYANGNVLVVTDYPEHLTEARRVLREVDARPQQVLVEATILRARLSEDNALGVDFTVLGGINFNQIEGAPVETRRAAMTGNIVDGGTGMGETGYTAGGTTFAPAGVDGLKVGIVYNNVAAFITALEQVTDTVVVANPKVLTVNKQKGEVLVGRQDGYPVLVQRETSTVQDVKMLDSGTKLVFRPFIGNDGYIRMEVHPEDSIGQVINGLPIKQTTEVTTNVMVRDGHTIVIGGLFREQSESMRDQVPYLGNIPIVGNLFRSRRDRTVREEVIILLTPHVVKDDVAYSRFSEEQLRSLERMRVGVRRGMMPWGRERLAESSYNRALSELDRDRPNRRKALWHLNGATNLNPMFSEAMDLKVTLTGQEITAVDGSSVRNFVRQQILTERAAPPAEPAEQDRRDRDAVQEQPIEQQRERQQNPTERVEDSGRSWPFALRTMFSALGAAGAAEAQAEADLEGDDLIVIETVVGADRDGTAIELVEEQPREDVPVIVDIQTERLDSFYIPLNDSK